MNTHSQSSMNATRILLVVEDVHLRKTLADILREEGYVPRQARSLTQAFSLLDEETFGLVLTEMFGVRSDAPLYATSELVRRASPTPVGLAAGWNITDELARNAGFAFCLLMPFELEMLLAHTAQALRTEMTPEQERQAEAARSYLDALSDGRLDDALALCADGVSYHLQSDAPPATNEIYGEAALRAYLADARQRHPGVRFEDVNVYALPGRLAARYTLGWYMGQERKASASGAVTFRFEDERIAEIGVEYNAARIVLMNAKPATSASTPPGSDNLDGQNASATS